MRLLALALALALAGCASKPPPPPQNTRLRFDPGAHSAWLAKSGSSEIRGRAFVREREEDPVTCAGRPVIAAPATPFFRRVIGLAAHGQMPLIGEAVGEEYLYVVRTGVCDKDGSFSIRGLPAGDWYVVAPVYWTVRNLTNGGMAVYRVRLRPKEVAQIVLTDRDFAIPQ